MLEGSSLLLRHADPSGPGLEQVGIARPPLGVLDFEARHLEKLSPFRESISPHMARIAPALEAIHEGIPLGIVKADKIGQQEATSRPQSARSLGNVGSRICKVMRRDAAEMQVETAIGEGQGFGQSPAVRDVRNTLPNDVLTRGNKHARRQVKRDNRANVWRKAQRGVPTTGGHIDHALITTWRC